MTSVGYPRGIRLAAYCAIVVGSLWCVVIAVNQKPSAAALPETLRAHLKNERLELVTSIRGLPLGVREELQTLFGSPTLDIAEPGAAYQGDGAVRNQDLPTRRLVSAGCSMDHCLVHYERGGTAHTWHVALFRWTPKATRFEWGGTTPRAVANIDDLRSMVLSGRIKGPSRVW